MLNDMLAHLSMDDYSRELCLSFGFSLIALIFFVVGRMTLWVAIRVP